MGNRAFWNDIMQWLTCILQAFGNMQMVEHPDTFFVLIMQRQALSLHRPDSICSCMLDIVRVHLVCSLGQGVHM